MRLTESSVAIRPRPAWEAIDLGILLAREHRFLLMTSWAIVTLPLFTLLSVVLWDYPSLAIFLFWWLKPAYERLPLLILSQALFGSAPTLKQALKAWPATLRNQLLPSLLWRRLSLSRSFHLPVQQLENLSGTERALRINLLDLKDSWAARLLTIAGAHLECSLWIGLIILFYAFIPQQVEVDWQWMSLLDTHADLNWLEHLTNLFYALALIIWGPVYVACGFTLYLNRRTVLEAWDIELTFRRLRQRLSGSAYALLIITAMGLTFSTAPGPAWAETQSYSCPRPDMAEPETTETLPPPDTPRLTHQALTSEAARSEITTLLQQPPFKNPTIVSGWRFPESEKGLEKTAKKGSESGLISWLNGLMKFAGALASLFELLIWTAVLLLVGLLIWRYRLWLKTFVSRDARKPVHKRETPQQLFGLQVSEDSLPNDVAASAEALWSQAPREALSLLYRALLSRLLTDYRLPLKNADTEGQVLARIDQLNKPQLSAFSHSLMTHWQNLAYGHRLPPTHVQQELCSGWRDLFNARVQP
ncbi:DUF4129 domain-containing protein [Pseudomonas sp. CDFA 602]|uniref:DUF4129 domain-containing protein n=1 Tax=Pseudomonas californiensis TaxID=2829823 RepID=UPI001E5B0D0C|nr:DUF4129 domain-containing protein [Pseudomonas californiensis]MCD5995219.1 DUF4129 domain-containing protein [Pseudomonas californiensis]MCD6000695.1 DUF4129 domain-containing protein [Pseudomonas californiensis]